jgi:hypothetical protein
MTFKTTPCSKALHDWEDVQRANDLAENLRGWAIDHLKELRELNRFDDLHKIRDMLDEWLR